MSVNLSAVPLNHSKKLWGRILYPLFNSFRMWQMEVLSVSTMSTTYNTLFKDVNNGHKEQYFQNSFIIHKENTKEINV